LAAAVYATVRYLLIEGTLHFSDAEIIRVGTRQIKRQALRSHWLSGDLEYATGAMPGGVGMDLSPAGDEILYVEKDGWPPTRYEIWRARKDGSGAVHLTERAGLAGINCGPQWSPDGKMIAFNHSDPAEGQLPCEAGFHIWVMAADGSAARRATPDGSPPTSITDWSPDGSRVLCNMGEVEQARTVTMDLWGQAIEVIPNVGSGAAWSPDGTMIASALWEEKEVDGRPGVRRALLVTKADGTDPKVLVEQFISNADAEAHVAQFQSYLDGVDPDGDWKTAVQTHVGPAGPVWSPSSEKIAFLAALPFDPDGLAYRLQVEVWIYDLATRELTRITHDDVAQHSLIWR
jgi:dipeptidyl aminopeptidase/acylaminoacyl peptidase